MIRAKRIKLYLRETQPVSNEKKALSAMHCHQQQRQLRDHATHSGSPIMFPCSSAPLFWFFSFHFWLCSTSTAHRPIPVSPPSSPPPCPKPLQTGTNNSPQRRTMNIPPAKSPTPATMLTFPGSLSGAKICVRKKRDHALSFGSTSGPRESCAGVKYAGPEWGGAARRAIVADLSRDVCVGVYGEVKS